MDELRTMPQAKAAEAAVLGCMLLDHTIIDEVVTLLADTAFYTPAHRVIYEGVVDVSRAASDGRVDGLLVRQWLLDNHKMEIVGGLEYLRAVIQSVPSSGSWKHYLEIVREKWMRREAINAAANVSRIAFDESLNTEEVFDQVERELTAVEDLAVSGAVEIESVDKGMVALIEILEAKKGGQGVGIPTGLYELDERIGGMSGGQLIVVAARPGMGKTSFALSLAAHAAKVRGKSVLVFSMEMNREEVAMRLVASETGVQVDRMRKGLLDRDDWAKIVAYAGEVEGTKLMVADVPMLTPYDLRAMARKTKRNDGVDLIVVDYLQLMHMPERGIKKVEEVTKISRLLKAVARELKVPVVALSQLSRAPEGREGHRPRLSDLRESGAIEQDADVVMFLHRKDYYRQVEGKEDEGVDNGCDVIIAKQRNGPVGDVRVFFDATTTRFENAAKVGDETHGSLYDPASRD